MIASIAKGSTVVFALSSFAVNAQAEAPEPPKVEVVTSIETQQWIGISPVSRNTLWVSGVNGRIARSTDAGQSWQYSQPGPGDLQFRDIEAIDDRRAYALSIGDNGQSRIYFTENGGRDWRLRYGASSDTFLNCMALSPLGEAWVAGDSVGDQWRIVRSPSGRNWIKTNSAVSEKPQSNEGGFASSGSCVRYANDTWIMGTGNADVARVLIKARFGIRFDVIDTPMQSGPGAGIFAVYPEDEDDFYIAGGHLEAEQNEKSRLWHYQSGEFTALPEAPLAGALYSLAKVSHQGDWLLTSNPSGAAAYHIQSETWHKLSDANIWNIQCHGDAACWLAGKEGYLAKLVWKPEQAPQTNVVP